MFGYVTVAKGQLTEEEFCTFREYYCGVCKATGKKASHIARLGLSYDITFLALVLSSVSDCDYEQCKSRCIVHPFKRHDCIKNCHPVDYAASVGVLLDFLKLADDWHDERSIKALFGTTLFLPGYNRVKKRYSDVHSLIQKQLDSLSKLENACCASIDKAADAFAKILEGLFTPSFITNESDRRALAWLGYNIGRWIYIMDAFNDIDDDLKTGSYNPLIAGGVSDKESCAAELEPSLTFTLENIASAFELIGFRRNRNVIEKIIYTSLKAKQKMILTGA